MDSKELIDLVKFKVFENIKNNIHESSKSGVLYVSAVSPMVFQRIWERLRDRIYDTVCRSSVHVICDQIIQRKNLKKVRKNNYAK